MDDLESPDSVCDQYAERGAKLTLELLDDDCVLIEGSALDLEFLGQLLLAQARFERDSGFEISPTGPGQALFKSDSTLGACIHRTDSCRDPHHGGPSSGGKV